MNHISELQSYLSYALYFQNPKFKFKTYFIVHNFFKIQIWNLFTLCVSFPKSKLQSYLLYASYLQHPKSQFKSCLRYALYLQNPNSSPVYFMYHVCNIQNPNSNPVYVMHYICKAVNHIMLLQFPVIPLTLCIYNSPGDRGSSVVKVLCYKSEGRWFDPSWSHWNFSLT